MRLLDYILAATGFLAVGFVQFLFSLFVILPPDRTLAGPDPLRELRMLLVWGASNLALLWISLRWLSRSTRLRGAAAGIVTAARIGSVLWAIAALFTLIGWWTAS